MPAVLIEIQYLPPIPYFAVAKHSDQLLLEACENYKKGSYRNRTYIAGSNGVQRLSIPLVKGKNQQQNIREVQIAYDQPWQSRHWAAIQSAYGRAPYFAEYAPSLKAIFRQKENYLFDWNLRLLQEIQSLLKLDIPIDTSTKYRVAPNPPIIDFRDQISPKKGIVESIPAYEPIYYPQVFMEKTGFLPHLSILDLLFCTGPEAILLLEKSVVEIN